MKTRDPVAHFDSVGATIDGWIFDPEADASGRFFLLIDETFLSFTPTIDRPDVRDAGLATHARVGFSIPYSQVVAVLTRNFPEKVTAHPRTLALATDHGVLASFDYPSLPAIAIGRLEGFQDGVLVGWIRADIPERFKLEVRFEVDGFELGCAVADQADETLGENAYRFSFSFPIWPTRENSFLVTAHLVANGAELEGSPLTVRASAACPTSSAAAQFPDKLSIKNIAIIVPVFNAAESLRRCLNSLFANTTTPAQLLLVNDASTDPAISSLLDEFSKFTNVRVIENAANLGFSGSVNRGIIEAGNSDVVLLNSDAILPPRWLENLQSAAYAHSATATVTALSNNAGLFSAPTVDINNSLPAFETFDEIGRQAAHFSLCILPETPSGNGFCMYIKRECLDDIGGFDVEKFGHGYGEENDFSLRAMRAGWRHIVDDRVFVFHERSASFGITQREKLALESRQLLDKQYPEYPHLVRAFSESQEMALVRHRVGRALAASAAGKTARPRLLTVIASETGGTPQTNADLCHALADRYDVFVLRSNRTRVTLSRFNENELEEVAHASLVRPITLAKHFSAEYDSLISRWLAQFAIEFVHIRHIAWHGLGLTGICRQLGIPVVFSFHDFYTVCPSLKLLDGDLRYCGGDCTGPGSDCVAELWQAADTPKLKNEWVNVWRAQAEAMLEAVDAFVTTSKGAAVTLRRQFHTVAAKGVNIIPHGRHFRRFAQAAQIPQEGKPIRVLAPGNLSMSKGAGILLDLVSLDTSGILEIHTIGEVSPLLHSGRIINHGKYDREEVVDLIASISPSFGLLLSVWPETFSHTLTELWAAGIPVLAFDAGAIGERMRAQGGGGALIEDCSAEAVLAALLELSAERERYIPIVGEVMEWQQKARSGTALKEMADAYDFLYQSLRSARNPFRSLT